MRHEISPLDGRYAEMLAPLGECFSEIALARERCRVELRYLTAVDRLRIFDPLSADEQSRIEELFRAFGEADYRRIKAIETDVVHDVKACELFLKERLDLAQPERVHFALTSADVNNLAYARLFKRYRDEHQCPQLKRLIAKLADLAEAWSAIPFPARTHGQHASPTTAGKEMAVFLSRLLRQAKQLAEQTFAGKLNGATGTYAAFAVAAPEHDWIAFSKQFVEELGLAWTPCTTQIEPGDGLAEYLALTARINTIVQDLDLDLWQYISHGEIIQKTVSGEVGSSTMPHKVNPIRFENSEGNITIANALLPALAQKLAQSRMQRDLSGSTVIRNVGVALAHSYLALQQTMKGLDRIDIDPDAARAAIEAHPEVLAEAIQTMLRREEVEDPYALLKSLTRGRAMTLDAVQAWVDGLELPESLAFRLNTLEPTNYVGLSKAVCEQVVSEAKEWLED